MNFHIQDPSFNQRDSSAYQLSILAGMDSLVYLVHQDDGTALLLKSIPFNGNSSIEDYAARLQDSLEKEELLSVLFRKVRLALPEARAVLVPRRLFKSAELHTYVDSLVPVTDSDGVYVDELPAEEVNVCYKVPLQVADTLRKHFPTARFHSLATTFIEGACRVCRQHSLETMACAGFTGHVVQLCVLRQGKLHFYNAFPFQASQDVLYFTMLLYERFQLDTSNVPLYLAGAISAESDIYTKLYSYVGDLRFIEAPMGLTFGKKFANVPPHLFFNLFALSTL